MVTTSCTKERMALISLRVWTKFWNILCNVSGPCFCFLSKSNASLTDVCWSSLAILGNERNILTDVSFYCFASWFQVTFLGKKDLSCLLCSGLCVLLAFESINSDWVGTSFGFVAVGSLKCIEISSLCSEYVKYVLILAWFHQA